jgi:dimethylamine/trimethylamine dehydrogenase
MTLACTYTGRESFLSAAAVVSLTSRLPNDELHETLAAMQESVTAAGIVSLSSIGDCLAPSTIAAAVYSGHRHAREFDAVASDEVPFRRELPLIE